MEDAWKHGEQLGAVLFWCGFGASMMYAATISLVEFAAPMALGLVSLLVLLGGAGVGLLFAPPLWLTRLATRGRKACNR